ncbi:S-adenosyl methyltransferase [Saccharopolyspora shandongensis]|uniref:S-adenosyl methyltransferase n=2 Tax=Saccharopolyspora shandongensis TaxID=418495 RepID=A0A1H3APU5_9PSEU|nr:S-adenosyl methyltransferase [Saccharopolyspora shandongensis]
MSERDEDIDAPRGIDLESPSVARVYDYFLGGCTNWAIDRAFGDMILQGFPVLRDIAVANRLFMHRVVRHLVRLGVRQIVDVGSGAPTMGAAHQVAQELDSEVNVVYIDRDPIAVAHSRLLLDQTGDPRRHVAIEADLREPDRLWQKMLATELVDPDEPIALLLIAVLHIQQFDKNGSEIGPEAVARYRELLPTGSFLAVSHITDDGVPEEIFSKLVALRCRCASSSSPMIWRSRDDIGALLGNFTHLSPGMCWTPLWYPEATDSLSQDSPFTSPSESATWAGVGHKRSA